MKKLFLIFAVALTFAACGGSKANKDEAPAQEGAVVEETIIEEFVDTTANDTIIIVEDVATVE